MGRCEGLIIKNKNLIFRLLFRYPKLRYLPLSMDNKHAVGSVVFLLDDSTIKLLVKKYYKRIYYCVEIGDVEMKLDPYFEHELSSEGAD